VIGLVWAQAANGVIGRDGSLPWHLPEDLGRFKRLTTGCTVVMGRATWDSLPDVVRPLPGRRNVVLTRDRAWTAPGAVVVHALDDALAGDEDVWVIGGAEVYRQALPYAGVLVVTELAEAFDGDATAPEIGPEWQRETSDPPVGYHLSASGIGYRVVTWRHRP
jgi:dihydrofolate reductase